jgi:diguanylate cyclase (GGDEF)-like protein/PAS domain S-box-containing protein
VDKRILRLLLVDESPDDVELAVATLRKHGYMLKHQRVHDMAGMQSAIDKGQWDAVVCEYQLPHFGAHMAHDLLKRAGLDIPLIVFTRAIADADLVKTMRGGIPDVVLKTQPARLAPAIERELKAGDDRRALHEAQQRLKELEGKNRAIIEGAREAICYIQDGMHLDANHTYLEMFGYQNLDELAGVPVMNLVMKGDQARFKEFLRKNPGDKSEPQEFMAVKADGNRMPVEFVLSPIEFNGEKCLQLLVTDISKRKAVESKLQYLNQHDPLTGLYNRHYFIQELNKVVDRARRGEESAAVLYIDMQQLKSINETVSYAAGDRLLIKVARLFREHLGEDALLSRFGGDEFAALLRGPNEPRARELADSLIDALKATGFTEGDKTYNCDCQLSVTHVDRHAESAQKILSLAYNAVQGTRPAAGTPAAVAPPAPAAVPSAPAVVRPVTAAPAPVAARAAPAPAPAVTNNWSGRLLAAIEKGSFTLIYQPVVNLHAEPAEFFEVLVRMVGEDGNLIAAGEFIAAAEQCGLAPAIDRWVIKNAIEALAALHREGRQSTFFVNLSRTTLKDPDLLPSVIRWLREANAKPDYLVFEADEPDLLAEPAAGTFIKAARKIGCHFAIDNFGKNLGATEHLREVPVEYLKIDGGLIRNLNTDPVSQTTLRAVLQVAQALEMKTIAKSVEKAENLAALWNFGIDYVQGYYFEGAGGGEYGDTGQTTLTSDTLSKPNWAASSR